MAGQGAKRRGNQKRLRAKQERKKAAKQAAQEQQSHEPAFAVPTITEDDLLAFQISHFGDDIKPDNWFVGAETALSYDPALEEDDLGYYEDGVKRTLTDEQIEMFTDSEMEQLRREERLQREQDVEALQEGKENSDVGPKHATKGLQGSDASSVEGDLLDLARCSQPVEQATTAYEKPSQTSRSERSDSTDVRRRPRKEEVPYDQRHKRKWEDYIEEQDPLEGSLTHRRIVRQLDEQCTESVELDY